jgi:hypothetical protein
VLSLQRSQLAPRCLRPRLSSLERRGLGTQLRLGVFPLGRCLRPQCRLRCVRRSELRAEGIGFGGMTTWRRS